MNPRDLELMHRAYDQECSPEELRELEALLAKDPELRREQERLRALDVRLRLLAEEEAPEELLEDVFERLHPAPARPDRRVRPFQRELVGFAVGVAAMLLLVLGLNRDALRGAADQATGTLLPPATASQPIRSGAEELGELRFVPSADGEWLEIRWRADRPASLTLDFEDSSEARLDVQTGGQTLNVRLDRPEGTGP